MNCNANGFAQQVLTLVSAADIPAGTPVSLSENYTAAAAAANAPVFGVVLSCRDGVCAVQVQGAVTLSYSGTAPAVGFGCLVSDGSGGVKTASDGTPLRILAVDSVQSAVTFML